VTSDGSQPRVSLLDAARVLARGRDLDAKLVALAEHARSIARVPAAVVLLWDSESETLFDAAGTPLATGADSAASRAVVDRAPQWQAPTGSLASHVAGAPNGAFVPLVIEDELGTQVEGLLVVGGVPKDVGAQDTLLALADLAAVAIRQARLHSALAERAEYLERLARTDGLTGLADRRTFDQMLELEIARATRQATALAVVVFDMDGFTELNERHGARAGDDALRVVASTIAEQVRLVDTVARVGQDEFGVIAPGDPSGVVARRVVDAVSALEPIGDARISVSAGVAHLGDDGTTADGLFDTAIGRVEDARRGGTGGIAGVREAD
jgi:diguanylate cyclase (GGDEF)-like protein